jgi:hypothetical protein
MPTASVRRLISLPWPLVGVTEIVDDRSGLGDRRDRTSGCAWRFVRPKTAATVPDARR